MVGSRRTSRCPQETADDTAIHPKTHVRWIFELTASVSQLVDSLASTVLTTHGKAGGASWGLELSSAVQFGRRLDLRVA